MKKLLLATLLVFTFGSVARAALILHIPDITLTQSSSIQTGSFDVWLEETDLTQATISSYNVGVRQPAAGALTFTGSDVSSATHPSLFGTAPLASTPSGYLAGRDIFRFDENVDANQLPENAAVSPTANGLFRVNYSLAADAVGTFSLVGDAARTALFTFNGEDAVPVAFVIDNGSITVTPVPEPAAMGLALLALPLLARRRR